MLKVGIVGLPNVGKSTLFNALTKSRKAQAANFPFCTIEPNVGVVPVPDSRLELLASLSKSERVVPATIEFVDIAGLVRGASKGEGLGNQFLSHIREVDAIVHVVRCFENSEIHHVTGTVDPIRDIEIVNTELLLADLTSLERRKEKIVRAAKANERAAVAELSLIERLVEHLNEGKPALTFPITVEDKKILKSLFLLTSKPMLFACNVSENDLSGFDNSAAARYVAAVRKFIEGTYEYGVVVVSAELESELAALSPHEASEYLAALGVKDSGVSDLIRTAYKLLGLRTFFTTGPKETRAWTIRAGDKAQIAAGVIHSDFQRGFIAAETISFSELITHGSYLKARESGCMRLEGKDYEVQDGDVIEFRFNV
ncbi:MAG: redox-regulated ATPase YchF [Chthoniobacterales bacterium]|nr:redox-regulated ATPase YchF [Chthoniobacterales bacterium]